MPRTRMMHESRAKGLGGSLKRIGDIRLTGDSAVWLLTVAAIVGFQALEPYSWGAAVIASLVLAIGAIAVAQDGLRIDFRIGTYHKLMLAFGGYCLLSSIWAWAPSDALGKGVTIIELLVFVSLMYMYYAKRESVRPLVSAAMWAGFILALYAIYSYGPSAVLSSISSGERLENSYSNINSIGMVSAMSIIIAAYFAFAEGLRPSLVLTLPCLLMVAAGGSRKALVMTVLGVALVIARETSRKKFTTALFVLLSVAVIGSVASALVAATGLFDASLGRMDGLVALITGEGKVDHSAWLRSQMVEIGLRQFFDTPLLGIGIGCPHILAASQLSFDAYLHNNYVELLAGGGVVGFALYYSMYAFPLARLWRKRGDGDPLSTVVLTMLLVLLVMDVGAVSYYSKVTYVYLMIAFLHTCPANSGVIVPSSKGPEVGKN